MKLFLKHLTIFLSLAVFSYVIISPIWFHIVPSSLKKNLNYKKGDYGFMFTRLKEVKRTKNVDVLFLGSSHAYRGFDNRVFESVGISSFNLGSSNQTPIQSLSLLKDNLDRLNPQLVIFEVYPGIFQNDGVESSLDLIANGSLNSSLFRMALRVNHLKTYNALIYKSFLKAFDLESEFSEPVKKPKDFDTYVEGGYVQKDDEFLRAQEFSQGYFWSMLPKQEKAFEKIVTLLESRGIELLMVQAPIDSTQNSFCLNCDVIDDQFETWGAYINFNDLMHLHYKEDLYDLHHLRQSGVFKFNKKVIEVINNQGYLR